MRGYFDHAATSPMRELVRAAYVEALEVVGNPSSIHSAGQAARALLEEGREQVAASLGADPMEIVLTGGGTESVNLAVKGLYWAHARGSRRRILLTRAEHHATLDAVGWLEQHDDAVVEWIPVDAVGRVDMVALEAAIERDPETIALVTSLWANNEVGTIQPVERIVALAARHGIPVHLDAIAAYGHVPIDAHAVGAAAISVSAHKIGGPVGVGALYLSRSAAIEPLLHGGDQQRARSGTMDAAGAHAFGVAATLATGGAGSPAIAAHAREMATLRDRFIAGVLGLVGAPAVPAGIGGAVLRGDPDPAGRLPGNVHLTFSGCDGDSLLFLLDQEGFAVSTGAACQAGVQGPSHVLLAMGLTEEEANGALRFTFGPGSNALQADALIATLPGVIEQARRAGRLTWTA